MNAVVKNHGFRKDGSFLYGDQIMKLIHNDSSARDFHYNDTYSRIDKGIRNFEYGDKVDEVALKVLNDLLVFCKSNNIYVVGILPPFADKVNERMRENKNHSYMNSIFSECSIIFQKYDFELWDMTDLGKYQSDDGETIDGFHGSEVSYCKMLIFMIENNSRLKYFTNLKKLKNDLNNRVNNYMVYAQ